ncbi:hypothetical protein [Paraburkholderia sp. UCT2]|uniref:hypothetical protein n=1 Tax=Paraburkholderia sp. UCT2 TaxID=2615208 RepID=UPI003975B944
MFFRSAASRTTSATGSAKSPGRGRPLQPAALLDVLHDRAPSGLPIYRDDPHDPDDENTLATALFEIGNAGVSMKAYRQRQCAFDTFVACATPEPARVSAPAALTRN